MKMGWIRSATCLVIVSLLAAGPGCFGHLSLDRGLTGRLDHIGSPRYGIDDVPVRGFDIDLVYLEGGAGHSISGELLAVSRGGVWVLEGDRIYAAPFEDVLHAAIEIHPSRWPFFLVWTVLGTVSTLTHGFYLVITAPVWLGSGIPITVLSARRNQVGAREGQFQALSAYARFPQGLPDGWPE